MFHVRTIALIVGTLLVSPQAFAADWPQWNGPKRDGHSADKGLLKTWPKDGPKLAWTFRETGFGYGSPAVVGDTLYIMGSEEPVKGEKEFVIAIGVNDGKERWRTPLAEGTGNYNNSYGNGPRATPTVDGDALYVLGARGDLARLETKSGKQVWTTNLVKDLGGAIPTWGYSESVLIDGEKLICTPGGKKGALAALNKKDGSVHWRSKEFTDGAQYSSVIAVEVGGVRQYIQQVQKAVVGIRATDGKLLWRENAIPSNVAVIPTPIFHDNQVFVTSGYGAGCALIQLSPDGKEGTSSKLVYANKMMVNHHGGVVRVGEYIYGYSDKGGWMCLDYKKMDKDTEDPVWKENKKLGKGSITFADGNLYCYAEKNGTLAMIEASPKGWNEIGRLELPEKTDPKNRTGGGAIRTHPVIANGKLYLRDMDLLFCFDLSDVH
jgi:outer membrane protein assembly factor BamB